MTITLREHNGTGTYWVEMWRDGQWIARTTEPEAHDLAHKRALEWAKATWAKYLQKQAAG